MVAKSAMRQVDIGYRLASQIFGVLVLFCVLVIIWWVLIGRGLGESKMRTMRTTHRRVLEEVVERKYVMEVVVEEEKSQWWGSHEKRGLEQWKVIKTWRWGSVVRAWE